MAFNDLLKQLGGVGRFQRIQVALAMFPVLLLASHNTLQNFTAAIPAHHCHPPAGANLSTDGALEAWLPRNRQGQPESCLLFASPQREPPSPNGSEANRTAATGPCTNGWMYDNSTFPSTIVTEGGPLEDFDLDLPTNFATYCVFCFLSSLVISSIFSNSLTLSLEWMPTHTRAVLQFSLGLVFSLSQLLQATLAYAVPHWRHLQLLFSLPFFIFFIYSRFFVESALWYSSSGRLDLTLNVLERVAKINRKQEEGAKLIMELLQRHLQKDLAVNVALPSMLQLLCSPAVRHLLLCPISLWSALNFSYYGLVLSLQSFGISIYLLQVIFAAADIVFHFLGYLATQSLGHRTTLMAFSLFLGICFLDCATIPRDQVSVHITMAMLGKGCLSSSLNNILVYAGELYPRVIRQRGLATTATLADMGSILSPLMGMATSDIYPSLPLFIYGAVPTAACTIIFLLPETQGRPLPNTLQDLERRWKKKLGPEQQAAPLQAS